MILKKTIWIGGNFLFFGCFLFLSICYSQQRRDLHQIGSNGKLLINVQIWGQVREPGEYLVPDDTDILELISKAGGPSENSNLSKVKITRGLLNLVEIEKTSSKKSNSAIDRKKFYNKYTKQIIKVNINKILEKEKCYEALPILKPGDIVRIPRNSWHTWQTFIRVVSQLAIIVQAWYWYNRID